MGLHRTLRPLFLCAAALLSVTPAPAQDPPLEWGNVSTETLSMKTYPADTNAAALILGDYGESYLDDELDVVFHRHLRIKILKEAGFEWGTHAITLYTKDDYEKIDDIEGATYTLGAGGKIVVAELEDDDVFEERVDDERTRYRLALPALVPGCVIELRYTVRKSSWFSMRSWYFQSTIPTLWSEYRAIIPPALSYAVATTAFEPFHINEVTNLNRTYRGRGEAYFRGRSVVCQQYRWVKRELPALKEEPFITTMKDYITRVDLQLAEYALSTGGSKKVLKTWGELINEMLESSAFGGHMDPDDDVASVTAAVTKGCATAEEKLKAIYDYVRSTILWDDRYRIEPEGSPAEIIEKKKGSSAEINMLLLNMLRSAGIDADPVFLSTRSHGRITEMYPLINQFNTFVVRARTGTSSLYLDAINPLRPLDLLSPDVLNVRGLVIKSGRPEWVTIPSTKRRIHRSLATMTLGEEGDLRGSLECSDEEYAALANRNALREKKPMEIARQVFDAERLGLTLDSVQVTGADRTEGPLHIRAIGTAPGFAQKAGEFLYFTPLIVDRTMSSAFTSKTREYPVDMTYGRTISLSTSITIPEGYAVKELPANMSFGVGNASYSRQIGVEGGIVFSTFRYVINSPLFPASKYNALREFYDKIVTAESEQVVLRRNPPPEQKARQSAPQKPARKGTR